MVSFWKYVRYVSTAQYHTLILELDKISEPTGSTRKRKIVSNVFAEKLAFILQY